MLRVTLPSGLVYEKIDDERHFYANFLTGKTHVHRVWKFMNFSTTNSDRFRDSKCKVWKFHDFCIPRIFREMNYVETGSAKSAV